MDNQSTWHSSALPNEVRARLVVCGERHTVVLSEGGSLLVCGRNDNYQLGLGHTMDDQVTWQASTLPDGKRGKLMAPKRTKPLS